MLNEKTSYNASNEILKRTIAYFIDSVIVFLLVLLLKKLGQQENVSHNFVSQIKSNINTSLLFAFYSFVFTKFVFKGQTVGKKLMAIKIVTSDEENVDILKLLNREVVAKVFVEKINLWILLILSQTSLLERLLEYINKSGSSLIIWYIISLPWVMFLSFAMMANSKDHLSLHDRLSGTKVVSKQ